MPFYHIPYRTRVEDLPGDHIMPFTDRTDAGRRLAQALAPFEDKNPLVVALPRGGVPVGYEVARSLGAPLDVLVTRRLLAPGDENVNIGAIGPGGVRYLDTAKIRDLGITDGQLEDLAADASAEVEARSRRFRGTSRPLSVRGRIVILVDDGIMDDASARLAARILRSLGPKRLILATPVAPPRTLEVLRDEVDGLVFLVSPEDVGSLDTWYREYPEISDGDVETYLHEAHKDLERIAEKGRRPPEVRVEPPPAMAQRAVKIEVGDKTLNGLLAIPEDAKGVVLFGHSSGSNRYTPRNQQLAEQLREAGLATLLVDLLTPEEAAEDVRTQRYRSDIGTLARRVIGAIDWLAEQANTKVLPVAAYGTGTSAALGVVAARQRPERVQALIGRSGRMDLVQSALDEIEVPMLLIVGEEDTETLEINREALQALAGPAELMLVPETGPIFEAPEVIEMMAEGIAGWCHQHLPGLEALQTTGSA